MLQQLVMGLHCGRDLRLHGGQVVKFVDHGDVQIHHAGLAMAAVGTGSPVRMKQRARKALHDGDSHIVLLADLVQVRPLNPDLKIRFSVQKLS